MPKICIIAPSLNLGGIERALTTVANYFDNGGYEVLYIACLSSESPFFKLNQTIKVITPSFRRDGSKINKISFYIRLVFFIRRSVINFAPDRVLVFGDWFSPLVLLALRYTSFPVFISDRTSPNYKFSFSIRILKKNLYPKSSGFIAQTKQAELHKNKIFGNRLRTKVIPNMISYVEEMKDHKKEKSILYAGRFAWEKAPERLIRAFAISSDLHDYDLHMAGSGPLLEGMKELAESLGIGNRVIFLGNTDDMNKLYRKAAIFVLPSVIEGFPNALAEAMSYGLPCIIFDDISHQDFITDGVSGYVVRKGNINHLSDNILKLTRDEGLRNTLGREARLKSRDWNLETIGKQLEAFIFSEDSKYQ